MIITGKVNPENNTVFVKVQIVSSDGNVRNVHFPFDIVHDTTMDVAMEMVKELAIADWGPSDIAEMIEDEISALLPSWKDFHQSPRIIHQREFIYEEEDDDDDDNNRKNTGFCNLFHPDPFKDETVSRSSCINSVSYSEISCYSEKDESGEILSFEGCLQSASLCPEKEKRNSETKTSKMRSFLDLRSQLLHKALMQAMHKKRSFKTIGAVESID